MNTIEWNVLVPTILGGGLSALASWYLSNKRMPALHRIAVIGYPQTGKTTLITAVFAYLFRHGIRGASIVPRGEETIARVNSNMESLELGRPIGATRDQDVFAYRAEVKFQSFPFGRRYKLEIGDFPGENSVEFTEQYGEWLHRTKYFEWAISADAFVFVIDVGKVFDLDGQEYVARQKSALRAAWQRIQEFHLDGSSNIRRKPLILAFTKADLGLSHSALGISESEIQKLTANLEERFSDLIAYLRRETNRFETIATSALLSTRGDRIGIQKLATRLLPRSF